MKYLYFILLVFTGCISEKQADSAFYPKTDPINENQWAFIDGVRVDKVELFYDYVRKTYRNAGIVGNDTIWEYDYTRKYSRTDSCIYYLDKTGTHKF